MGFPHLPAWLALVCCQLRSNDPTLSELRPYYTFSQRFRTPEEVNALCLALSESNQSSASSSLCLESLDLDACLDDPDLIRCFRNCNKGGANDEVCTDTFLPLRNIKILGLGCNSLRVEHAQVIGSSGFLGQCTELQKLSLYNNDIGDDGAAALAVGLRTLPGLKELRLAHNSIGDVGCWAIVVALRECCGSQLRDLSLYDNKIGDEGAKALASLLYDDENRTSATGRTGTSTAALNRVHKRPRLGKTTKGRCLLYLQKLSLFNKWIGDEGVRALSTGLLYNMSLMTLYLDNNRIRDSGCSDIASALEVNIHLKRLDIQRNRMTDVGGSRLEASLRRNLSLEECACRWNDGISGKNRRTIDNLCRDNRNYAQLVTEVFHGYHDDCDQNTSRGQLAVFPQAVQVIRDRPDMLYEILQCKPELFLFSTRSRR